MNFADSPSKFQAWPVVLFVKHLRLCWRLTSRIRVGESTHFVMSYDYYILEYVRIAYYDLLPLA